VSTSPDENVAALRVKRDAVVQRARLAYETVLDESKVRLVIVAGRKPYPAAVKAALFAYDAVLAGEDV
jgi:hypothetical protein